MPNTGLPAFDTTVDKTNRILHQIEEAYGWTKERRNESYAALRAVLHTLRDRLTVDEAAQLSAQLPMLVRGIYFEGWDPSRVPVKMDRDEFFARIQQTIPYPVDGDVQQLTQRVLQALRDHITDGEWEDVLASVPKGLAAALAV
jgi:uncharacterized protein (DUF2267 family)